MTDETTLSSLFWLNVKTIHHHITRSWCLQEGWVLYPQYKVYETEGLVVDVALYSPMEKWFKIDKGTTYKGMQYGQPATPK